MNLPLAAALLFSALPAAAPLDEGSLLTYQGEIVAAKGDPDESKKTFQLQLLVEKSGDEHQFAWTLSEKGHGGWPWPAHLGRLTRKQDGSVAGDAPALVYDHDQGYLVIPLAGPLFAPSKPLAKGATWREDRLSLEVKGEEKIDGRAAWIVEARTPTVHKRTLHVDQSSGLVAALEETVFMGPGEEHLLEMVLVKQESLAAEPAAKASAAMDSLLALRKELAYTPLSRRANWNDRQQATLKEKLPAIIEQAADTPLAELALRAAGDAKLQQGIAAAVEKLAKDYTGRPLPKFELPAAAISGKPLSHESLQGKVSVLHLWDYRDQPLVEPYGQIGYLDFLHRKWQKEGVAVYGVSVDERLRRASSRGEAVRSVRKLRSFMNLGYPVVLDHGDLLPQLGDPTRFGAELPLFIVVGRDGKITHYHVGLYEVSADRGLSKLDEAVQKAVKQ